MFYYNFLHLEVFSEKKKILLKYRRLEKARAPWASPLNTPLCMTKDLDKKEVTKINK